MELPEPPEAFAGYELRARLGAGGFAVVYAAVDPATGQQVAIKLLRPEGGAYPADTVARFRREAAILGQLKSPHCVRLLSSGTSADGLHYLVFERVPGEDLAQLLERRGRLDRAEVLTIVVQVLDALAEAHARGLIHRDLKPENIRVWADAAGRLQAKLLDFGIARAAETGHPSVTRTGELIGTPRYMSPEQLRAQVLTPASDVYSLGLVAFELLVGRDGLPGNALGAQIDRLATGFRLASPQIDADLSRVLAKMTAPDPTQRYPAALAARVALQRLRDGESGAAGDRTEPWRAPSSAPRSRRAGLVLAAGLVIGALFLMWPSPERPAAPRQDVRTNPLAPRPPQMPAAAPGTAAPPQLQAPRPRPGAIRSPGCGRPAPASGSRDAEGAWRYLPPDYEPNYPHPTVVLLHTDGQSPQGFLRDSGFVELADQERLVLIAPRDDDTALGFGQNWRNFPEDPDRAEAAYARAADELCLDRGRTFIVADGDGGRAAEALVCRDWVTAVGINSFLTDDDGDPFVWCGRDRGALILVSPTQSQRLRIDGVRGCEMESAALSLDALEGMWRTRNGCGDQARRTYASDSGECQTWECTVPVESCRVAGGAGWPGASVDLPLCGEVRPADFPTADVMWNFFARVPPRPQGK